MRLPNAVIELIRLVRTTTPASPASGYVYFYVKDSDGKAYLKNSSGTEALIGATGMTLIEEKVASASASLTFTSLPTSTYDELLFDFIDIIPATTSVELYCQLSVDNGSTYDSTSLYVTSGIAFGNGGNAALGQATGSPTSSFKFRGSADHINTTSYGMNGRVTMVNLDSGKYKQGYYHLTYPVTSALQNVIGHLAYQNNTAVDAIKFYFSSGNIASGTIRLYGLNK